MAHGQDMPESIRAAGISDKGKDVGGGGAELAGSSVLKFGSTGSRTESERGGLERVGGMAVLTTGWLGESTETTTYVGTKGRITLLPPGHCGTKKPKPAKHCI